MVEFRLYYDDNGNVICYTCDELEGNYLIIDHDTFSQCRHDIKIIDGEIINLSSATYISKLVLDSNGISCAKEDITIIVDNDYSGKVLTWSVKTHEYKHS